MKDEQSKLLLENYLNNKISHVTFKLVSDEIVQGLIIGYFYDDDDYTSVWQWHMQYLNDMGKSGTYFILDNHIKELVSFK
jgi:hypothetical protein